jgi:hypothetical protein
MKKLLTLLFVSGAIASAQAQTNLQVHYDFGKNRQFITTTLEMFKPDKWGNTFFFVDYDFGSSDHAPSASYMEIARCINTWGGPLSLQVEYNGGLGRGYGINNAWLIGGDYSLHNADFSKTLNLKALYKQIMGRQSSFQFTGVWGVALFDKKVSFTGFADWWLEDNLNTNGHKTQWTFISEPQLWYHTNEHLSLGGEVELSSNFARNDGFMVNPTLGVKWDF